MKGSKVILNSNITDDRERERKKCKVCALIHKTSIVVYEPTNHKRAYESISNMAGLFKYQGWVVKYGWMSQSRLIFKCSRGGEESLSYSLSMLTCTVVHCTYDVQLVDADLGIFLLSCISRVLLHHGPPHYLDHGSLLFLFRFLNDPHRRFP